MTSPSVTTAELSRLFPALDTARSMTGPLCQECRARIAVAVESGSPSAWQDARTIIVDGTHTLWQLVREAYPEMRVNDTPHPLDILMVLEATTPPSEPEPPTAVQ